MRSKILTGAGVKCLINNQVVGSVNGVQWTITTQREEDRGIDFLEPFELSPTHSTVSGSVSLFRLRDDGGIEGLGAVSPLTYISTDSYFTLELKDVMTGSTYLKVEHAAVDSQSWSISPKGLVQGSFAFHGLSAKSSYNN